MRFKAFLNGLEVGDKVYNYNEEFESDDENLLQSTYVARIDDEPKKTARKPKANLAGKKSDMIERRDEVSEFGNVDSENDDNV